MICQFLIRTNALIDLILLVFCLHANVQLSNAKNLKEQFEQNQKYMIRLDSIFDVVRLDSNWLYYKGDNVDWAAREYNDLGWDTLSTGINVQGINSAIFEKMGWFRLHLEIDSSLYNRSFALLINQNGASEIFVNGGKVGSLGSFATDSTEEIRYNPKLIPLSIQFDDNPEQIISVRYAHSKAYIFSKRYSNHNAGFTLSIAQYDYAMNQLKYMIVANNFFLSLIMIFFILGLIHVLLFLFYRKKTSNLYYSIFLLIFSLVVYFGKLQNAISPNPDLHTKINFFVAIIIPFFFVALLGFIYSLFYKKIPITFWISVVLGMTAAIANFFNLSVTEYLLIGIAVLVPIEIIRVLVRAILRKMDGAWIIGTGVVLFVVFFMILFLVSIFYGSINISSSGPIQIIFLSLLLLAILSTPLSMSIYLARDIARTSQNLEKQLENVKVLSAKTLEQEREKKKILENQKRKLEILVKERTKELETEKQKTEELLLNTLPLKVVNDLKENGKTSPESFDDVTVYFSDIVGFTSLSSKLQPDVLINELNDIFTAFDDIMVKHKCERIKTIGDAYLAVCGMPEKNDHHARNMIQAAIEIRQFLENRNKGSKIKWKIRIGIHSGRVVGGIVGVRKYIYDVFGDTINTTSRMESNSEPMKINVSESTFQLAKDDFEFIKRTVMEIKGLGLTKMYFLK